MNAPRRGRAAVLAARREALVALSQVQREVVALRWHRVEPSLHWVGRGWQAVNYVRSHPWVVVLPLAAVAMLRPRWSGRIAASAMALSRFRQFLR